MRVQEITIGKRKAILLLDSEGVPFCFDLVFWSSIAFCPSAWPEKQTSRKNQLTTKIHRVGNCCLFKCSANLRTSVKFVENTREMTNQYYCVNIIKFVQVPKLNNVRKEDKQNGN
ncbi:hypothetical protein ABWK42_13200 [Bacillus sp. JJ927]|uniref:hypothetical protein n=1 Tax=Bacillus sp. JJ927 TaxID=3122976 RepID=UPI00339783C6